MKLAIAAHTYSSRIIFSILHCHSGDGGIFPCVRRIVTSLPFALSYHVWVSWRKDGRTDRDAVTFSLFSVIALWWMSQAASALAVVSNALQRYQRLGSDMIPIADQIDTVTECTLAVKDCTYAFHYYKPMYTYAMHQCVGTAALVTKVSRYRNFYGCHRV